MNKNPLLILKEPIIAITPNINVKRKLELYYGVTPIVFQVPKRKKILTCAKALYNKKLLSKKDLTLFCAGLYTHKSTNLIEIHIIKDLLNSEHK